MTVMRFELQRPRRKIRQDSRRATPLLLEKTSALTGKVGRVDGSGGWMSGDVRPTSGGVVAGPVCVRRLADQEGQKLQQVVRRSSTSSGRYRRAMMLLASDGGNRVPVIAKLVQADEDTVRDVNPPVRRDRPGRPGPSMGGRPSPPAQP